MFKNGMAGEMVKGRGDIVVDLICDGVNKRMVEVDVGS